MIFKIIKLSLFIQNHKFEITFLSKPIYTLFANLLYNSICHLLFYHLIYLFALTFFNLTRLFPSPPNEFSNQSSISYKTNKKMVCKSQILLFSFLPNTKSIFNMRKYNEHQYFLVWLCSHRLS